MLGIDIDKNISWKSHIQNLSSRISRFTYALWELKRSTDTKTATTAYYAYAHSWLSYGIILWGNSTDAPKIFTLQKKCIRILANIHNRESCKPHFINLRILTLISIYILEVCKFVRKNLQLFPQARDKYTCTQNLRYLNKLAMPQSRLGLHSSSTYVMAIKVYNSIPEIIASEIQYNKFVKKLKIFLINHSFYTLQEFLDFNKYKRYV